MDTSGLYALVNARDTNHRAAVAALDADPGPYILPTATLGELTYLVEARLGQRTLDLLLGDVVSGAYLLDCGDPDLGRARELVARYADLPLGFVDAAVIACAERNGGRVLTFDRRDFGVVARESWIRMVPA